MKKLILTLIPSLLLSQVGINTPTPTATLDVNGNLRVRQIPTGTVNDSVVVVRNGYIKKIALSQLINQTQTSICPQFNKPQSNPFYLLFTSTSSIPSPNNPLTINNLSFVSAGSWVMNNTYYYSYSNTSGQPLNNISNFTVNFNGLVCTYNNQTTK